MKSYTSETRRPSIDNGSESLLNKIGNAVYIVDAPGDVLVTTSNGDTVTLSEGRGFRFASEYIWLRLRNEGTSGLIVVIVGGGDYIDAQISGAVDVNVSTNFDYAQVDVGLVAVQVAAPNANRKKGLTIKSMSTNTDAIYIGDVDTVTALDGFELEPGEALTLQNRSGAYAIAAAAGQRVCVIEE